MSTPSFTRDDIVGIEPKHVTYVRAQDGSNHDALVVKEVIHLKDKRRIPNLRIHEDYKRPFWITHKGKRNHRDKKDYEYASHCQKYTSTQIELPRAIAKLLNEYSYGPNPPLRKLARSPYLYGVDATSSCLIKGDYRNKWPGLISPNRVAGGDIETNVHTKEQEIICMSVTHKERAALFYLKDWISSVENPIEKTHEYAERYIGDYLKKRNITLEVYIVDKPEDIVIGAINKLHEWKPDFFTFWNMDFDISNMLNALHKAGIDPASVFSDPAIPKRYQYCDYRQGPAKKVTASGKSMTIAFEDRWNWLTHPASFQVVDSMPIYRVLRLAAGKDSSYSLDYILQKELNLTKLKFDQVQHLTGLRWHEVMQEKYKIEYGIYNIFDSLSLELLDEKTNDLALDISLFSKNTDYKNFNSSPKRLCDDMHFWYLNRPEPCVIGSSSDEMVEELDGLVVGHEDWISISIAS